jgi:hypothetical protein
MEELPRAGWSKKKVNVSAIVMKTIFLLQWLAVEN